MRLPALAALAALAACSVKLEGAPCATDANCPDSQRCEVVGAQAGRCVACETDPACTSDGFTCADLHTIRECRTNAGTCHYARSIPCGTLTCGNVPANGSCPCPANTGVFAADPVKGSPLGPPFFATGASSPAQCRFRNVGDALSVASTGETVKMMGWSQGEMRFGGAATGESFPLVVKAGVTLTTDDSPLAPAHYVIEVDQDGSARPVLQLDHGAAASGFTVRPGAGGSASQALLVSCSAPGSTGVALTSLLLDGKGSLPVSAIGDGLGLTGPCSVAASSLVVQGASGAGIRVGTSVPVAGASSVSIADSTIRGNADSGLVVNVDASNGKPSLSVTGNDVSGNGATTAYTDGATRRRGGGVVLLLAVPQGVTFTGNAVHGNSYDQLLVWSPGTWNLSASACGAASNTFACYDAVNAGGPWLGVSALGGASVQVSYNSWVHGTPSAGVDYFQALGSSVSVGTTSCPASTLACP